MVCDSREFTPINSAGSQHQKTANLAIDIHTIQNSGLGILRE